MLLRTLPAQTQLNGKRIFLRVDWNVPLDGSLTPEASLKISRSIETIRALTKRGAIVILATYLGRPTRPDKKWSTRQLAQRVAEAYKLPLSFWDSLEPPRRAKEGDVYLLENVRFHPGEEKNDPSLVSRYAAMADLFVNDAISICHRSHASIVGIAKRLESFAGPHLIAEVDALSHLLKKPKRSFVAIIGGAKISTKAGVLRALLAIADRVMVGGAMATSFFSAKKMQIGKSFIEPEGVKIVKQFIKHKRLLLPIDVVVARRIMRNANARAVPVTRIGKTDAIGDIGPETMRAWSEEIQKAKTIVWNGPVGVAEIPTFAHGSLVIGRAIASRSKGRAFGVVGGGDTLPIAFATGMSEWIDHLSTGGGAMLEFIAKKGKLPGLVALQKKQKKRKLET